MVKEKPAPHSVRLDEKKIPGDTTLLNCSFCGLLVFLCCSCREQDFEIQCLEGIWPRDTCSMPAEAGDILDTRSTVGVPIFDGTGADWESSRVEFEAHADLANMGAHLDVAAEQTSFITHDGLDANRVTMSKTVHALLITTC